MQIFNTQERNTIRGIGVDVPRLEYEIGRMGNDLDKQQQFCSVAENQLNHFWGDADERIAKLISHIHSNFDLMRKALKWRNEGDSLEGGFEVNAEQIRKEDIKNMVRNIINELSERFRTEDDKKVGDSKIYTDISDKFYRFAFKKPEIYVRFPGINNGNRMPFSDAGSEGQKVAMSLLWMVKLSDFAIERELARETASSRIANLRIANSIKKKLSSNIEQRFFIIDGFLSKLSKKKLIDEALKSIEME
jgi:hypothetical protein